MAGDDDELIQKVQPDALKKNGYCFIRGMPCKIAELEVLPKATANGNKRLRLRGPHAFTGKIYGEEESGRCMLGCV